MHDRRPGARRRTVGGLSGCWLAKLDAGAAQLETIAALARAVRDPGKALALRHSPRLTLQLVLSAERLPTWVCSVPLLELLAECGADELGEDLIALCEFVGRALPGRRAGLA